MDSEQLKAVMLYHLNNFNDEQVSLSEITVHEQVLSTADGFGASNSKNIYKNVIKWTLRKAKGKEKLWPTDWMKWTVADLASKLLILFILMMPFAAKSQLEVHIGAGKTELREAAMNIGIKYLRSFDSIWKNSDYMLSGKNSLFSLSPEVDIQTGTEDAFSTINLKLTGLLMTFKTTTVEGIETPNTGALFNTFPVSLGIETNNLFNNVNGIVEAGWVPWYQTEGLNLPAIIKRTKLGIFLQGGYKFNIDSNTAKGGGLDQSEELPETSILRAKGSFAIDTKAVIKVNGLNLGLVGASDVWYDFLNSKVYYRIEGRGRFYIDTEKYIDIIYQKGSGAPNFNQGDQYGIGLTITL